GDVPARLAARRQRLPARLPLRPSGGGHDDAAQRIDGARPHQRPGEGGRPIARFLAGDPRRRAVAVGPAAEVVASFIAFFAKVPDCLTSKSWLWVKRLDLGDDDREQRIETLVRRFPDNGFDYVVVIVPQNVSNPHDLLPRQLWVFMAKAFGQSPRSLVHDLERAHDRVKVQV